MVSLLIAVLVILLIAGLVIYLIDLLPVDGTLKLIGKVVVLLIVILYLAQRLGVL